MVGVNEITDDWSLDDGDDGGAEEDEEHVDEVDTVVADNSQTEVQEDESLSELMAVNNSGKHVPYFVVENGSQIYKTTCLTTIFKSESLSKDRLRRV